MARLLHPVNIAKARDTKPRVRVSITDLKSAELPGRKRQAASMIGKTNAAPGVSPGPDAVVVLVCREAEMLRQSNLG